MRIGIDIDGVLTNLEQFHLDYGSKYCVQNNIAFDIVEMSYDISETFKISKEQEKDLWNKYLSIYAKDEKARPLASEVIKKLKKEGHEIYIITARWSTDRYDDIGKNMREVVKEWLIEHEIIYDKLIFSKTLKEKKSQEIIDNEIDLMIEDSPININELSSIIPIICFDARYNRDCINDKIIRCYSWYDIYAKIQKIKGDN